MVSRRIVAAIMLSMLTSALVTSFLGFPIVKTQEQLPAFRVFTDTLNVGNGQNFSVDVAFENIPEIPGAGGFDFNLTWNPSIVEALSLEEVAFHTVTPESERENIWELKLTISNGSVWYACTWMVMERAVALGYAPISGNGTLARITFRSIAYGETALHFARTVCGDVYGNFMPTIYVDGRLIVTIPGDANGDFTVDIYDAILLAGHFNEHQPWLHPNLDPNLDINGDEAIDIYDAIILANHYNEHYP